MEEVRIGLINQRDVKQTLNALGNAKEPLWTKDFILLSFSNLFLFFGFQMLLPTLPVYISGYGGTDTDVGLVIGIFTVSALLVRPFSGAALDRFGRKRLLMIGLLICLLAIGSYHWTTAILAILSLRFVHGLGWGISTTTYGTIAADLIPPSRRGEGMGYYGLSTTLAMAIGPVTGIWMIGRYGFPLLFLVSFSSTILSVLLTRWIHLPLVNQENTGQDAPSFLSQLYEKKALFPSLLILLMTVTYGGIVSFITLFGKEAGIENVGWFFSANAFFLFIIRPISGKVFDKYGAAWVLIPGAVSGMIGVLLLSYAASTLGLIAAAIFYGLSFGAIQPSLQAWLIQRVSAARRGVANATFFSAFDLGIGGGAMMLGAIASLANYAFMYRFSALLFILFLIVYFLYLYQHRNDEARKPEPE